MEPGLTPVAWDLPLSVLKAYLALLEPRAIPGKGRATLMQSTRPTGGGLHQYAGKTNASVTTKHTE